MRAATTVDSTALKVDTTAVTVDEGISGNAVIVLPEGYEGQTITIKDDAGIADAYPFDVQAASIDNAESVTFDIAFVTVKVLFSGGGWWIVSKA